MGSLSLLQGIFATHRSNPGLLHCRRILYHLSHKGSPRILQWAACPFSRGSSRPRNWTGSLVLLHCRWILYQLSHKGSPRILELVAYPSSSGSSWPRNRTRGSCIAGRFFTNWGIREIATFRLKLKKVGKITRPFRYDLNQPLMIIQWRWWIDSRY